MIVPNRKILVVDDDPKVLDAYRQVLVVNEEDSADELMELLMGDLSLEQDESEKTVLESSDAFDVTTASAGEEAIELFKQAQEEGTPFASVFLDVRMPPGMDGVECAGQLKRLDPDVYIVIVSAYSDYSIDDIHNHVGHDFLYLQKPFRSEELAQVARFFAHSWGRHAAEREKMAKWEAELEHYRSQ